MNGYVVSLKVEPGTQSREALDWATRVLAMEVGWAERLGLGIWERHHDRFVGSGEHDVKRLEAEHGVHRFVRCSPFDFKYRRHTTFTAVYVNVLTHPWEVEPEPKPLDQIRSYVLDPYTMAKDHRTSRQTDDVWRVLSGDLEPLVLG